MLQLIIYSLCILLPGSMTWEQVEGPPIQLSSGNVVSYTALSEGTVIIQLSVGADPSNSYCQKSNVQIVQYIESMYDYFPDRIELETAMENRYLDLHNSNSPFLSRAATYNQLLVDSAFLVEDVRRLKRAAYYLRKMDELVDIDSEISLAEDIEKSLDNLYKIYGGLFILKNLDFGQFDSDAALLGLRIASASQQLVIKHSELHKLAHSIGKTWSVPPIPEEKPIIISPDGTPNQIVFITRSRFDHFELEEPLTINKIREISVSTPSRIEGVYSWQSVFNQWIPQTAVGVTAAALTTHFAVHDTQITPLWFREAYESDPDIILMAEDGSPIDLNNERYQTRWPLNIWRSEVRELTADLATQFAQTFRDSPEFLWYVTAPENTGPYFSTKAGYRSIGYNLSSILAFQSWLKEQYTSIENINQQWQTSYQTFDEIIPPSDLMVVDEWERPHPCGSEFHKWVIDYHLDWQKMIYDTLKQNDPTTPVLVSHNRLLTGLDGSRIAETADVIGYHSSYPRFMSRSIYIYSLNRFAQKQLGQRECFWGIQEDRPRASEEKIQHHGMMKYLYRLTNWGRHIQTWWYAYTPAWYMTYYNSNWFNPTYDLTTLRYCTGALPVGKAKVKRLEEIFMNSTIIPSRVLVLQPNASMLSQRRDGESSIEIGKLHNILFENNIWYEIIPETYFEDGRASLDNFDVVVLPYTLYFYDGFATQLDSWIQNGGFLLSLGPFGLYDKFGFDKPTLWNNIFNELPIRTERYWEQWHWIWSWTLSDNNSSLVEKFYGSGKVMTVLKTLLKYNFAKSIENDILTAIAAATPLPVTCSPYFESTIRESNDGKRYLSVLNRNVDDRVMGVIILQGEYQQGVDLDIPNGFPITFNISNGRTYFFLTLDPGEFTVIALE